MKGNRNSLCVIDGDLLAYRCAAANEKRTVVAVHNETLRAFVFNTATSFKEWAEDEASNYTLTPKQEAGPIEHTLAGIKRGIESILTKAKCDKYHIVISGKNNFRLDLPLPTRYKDSRKDSAKPLQLQQCKDYLVDFHAAEIADGVEADDILTGYMYQGYKDKEYIVQASIDKDATHGPGWLLNWTTMDEPEFIEGYGSLECILKDTGVKKANGEPTYSKTIKGKGRAFLWFQLLYGDPVDCYKPCEIAKGKLGEVGAYDILCKATNDKEALEAVVAKYKAWYPSPVTYKCWKGEKHTKTWLEIMQMYADCAFMRRWEGDRLNIANILNRLGIDNE